MVERGAGTGVAEFEAADRHLRKAIPLQHLTFLSIGAIIGSGWLFASMKAASVAGPAAVVSWVVGGIFIVLIALSWAELSGMLPRTGAIVRYPALTHGSFTGWIVGWAYWLSAVTVPAIEAEGVVTYLGGRFPQAQFTFTNPLVGPILSWPRGILFGFGLMLVFFVINFYGIRLLAEWNRWFVWWKLVVPVATFIFLFFLFKGSNFTAYSGFTPRGWANVFEALSTTGIVFAYLGFRQALDFGGESTNPQRDIPLATIGSVVVCMIIYALLQVAFIGAIDWHAMGVSPGDWAGITSGKWSTSPLYSALTSASIGAFAAMATVLIIDAGISPSGTGWIYMGTSARVNYGLSIARFFPRVLQRMNNFGIPWVALLAALVVGCIMFVPAPSWYLLVGFITSTTVITYLMGGVSLPVLRSFAPGLRRPFRLGAAWLWAPVGFLAAVMIVYWSGFGILDDVFAAIFIGFPIFAAYFVRQRGWASPIATWALAGVFLVAWIYINKMGGWTLAVSGQVKGSWPFPVYDVAFSAAVIFFCVGLWLLSNRAGREHVQKSAWLLFLILALFPLSYWGEFGPLAKPALIFPWGTLVAAVIGLISYVWGARSGIATPELREILRAHSQELGSEPLGLLPGSGSSRPTADRSS